MSENQDIGKQNAFIEAGRFLGRSRTSRCFVAVAVAALFSGLAYYVAHQRDLAITILAVVILAYGFRLAWRMLPISSVTRARWACESAIAEQCPASRYRDFLWLGIGFAMATLCGTGSESAVGRHDFYTSGIFIVIGVIGHIRCRRFVRKERGAA